MCFRIDRRIVLQALLAISVCQSPLSAHTAPESEHHNAADPLTTCILSTLDLRKADELGGLVAASGKYWVKSPSGGVSDPYLLKHLDLTNPAGREFLIAVNSAESLIFNALTTGADNCGIDEDELEHAAGALLGLEYGISPPGFVQAFTSREQKAIAAFRTIRATLLNSQEFQQGYQRVTAEREALKKSKEN